MDIALKKTYKCEEYIASSIKCGLSVNKKWDYDWKQYQNKGEYNLSDEQVELLHSVCENNVVILTGGAGMGKSASTKMLIQMLDDNNKTFVLAAPTGKSAKVLKDFSETDAKTIHRALAFNPSTGWGYNKENKIDCDVFLIDELSMVSVELMTHVIDAIDFNNTKLVMIGDPNQLPSVQAGNILHDFLASNVIPVVKLTKVFRYGTGGILTAATDIINGNKYIPDNNNKVISFGDDGGYTFIKSDDKTIINEAVSLYKKLITIGINGYVYKPEEIAVLTAYNKGDYGAVVLNNYLQRIANKNYGSELCCKHGETTYYLGDIVMQRVNNYEMQVYEEEGEAFVANGECSKISLIDKNFIISDFDDIRIRYNREDLSDLALSYSYTIHKSQGSTIKIVIVISPRSHIYMSSANLLYVAVTRSSNKCFHFGLPSTINIAMKKKENFNRMTFMQNMLKSS
jgi:exodeoxyribonuclease V alpha subunit